LSACFQSFPVGDSINGSPHSVCVSLPTMADVVGYEEKDPGVLSTFTAGYPRFFRNPLIAELASRFAGQGRMRADDPLLPTEAAARELCEFLGLGVQCVAPVLDFWTVRLHQSQQVKEQAKAFQQHTGCGISSREAEAMLERCFGRRPFSEERRPGPPGANMARILARLHAVYGTASESDIHIFRSGMNAFYAGFRALQEVQLERRREIWIQLGWIYVDTSHILEKFAPPGAAPLRILNVADLSGLEQALAAHGPRVAAIVTEAPTNPLVQTPDLAALRQLADRHGAALVLDPSLVSPHNVNVLRYADIHINSLTKYAASGGDIMMGALALNRASPLFDELSPLVARHGTLPSSGDLARMAIEIEAYPETIRTINANTIRVAEFLEKHPRVSAVHWAHSAPTTANYQRLQQMEAGPGAIVTFSVKRPLAEFHDPSHIVKSPSFGTRFTMMCPFMYLAHYDLVRDDAGRARLRALGVDPDLIRLSVGCEPADAIIGELARTL
jgi:cystathionine gamma-synthase